MIVMMKECRSMAVLERQSSIEKEPQTLTMNQMQLAREAALYVVNTRSIEEAVQIFTEGLEPVISCVKGKGNYGMMESREEGEMECSTNFLKIAEFRDIASAPF